MDVTNKRFLENSKLKAFDLQHRSKITFTLKQSEDAFKKGRTQFNDLEVARRRSKNIKWDAIENLDKYLLDFEKNFVRNGGKVIWAENAQQARDAVLEICKLRNAKTIVKSKSMVTEEIQLNTFLSGHSIEVIETDLGEYIQQLDGEPPYHIVSPAMHKSRADVARLFHEKLAAAPDLSAEELTLVGRNTLRHRFRQADIGITGVNYLLSDIGGIAVTENEGNAWLSASFPRTHIAITGIEKVLPSVEHLQLFWPLLSSHGSGQKVATYNSIFTGPRQAGEFDGPEEMYVILLDNERTSILSDTVARESLYCIRCGACLNVCPVYKNIGGHTYDTTYSGPIGAVITPYLKGFDRYQHLSFASTLCGACTEVCPVHINLHQLLLQNRRRTVETRGTSTPEKIAWYAWTKLAGSRKLMDLVTGPIKNFIIRTLFRRRWGKHRQLPAFREKSFSQLWKQRKLDAGAKERQRQK